MKDSSLAIIGVIALLAVTSYAKAESIANIPRDRKLTESEVRSLVSKHFPADQVDYAVLISKRESSFRPDAHNTKGEDSRGLFQINMADKENRELYGRVDLFDPEENVRVAAHKWRKYGWKPWSTHKAKPKPKPAPKPTPKPVDYKKIEIDKTLFIEDPAFNERS